ncbi:MAG: LPS export ABC transporter permease LptG [Thiogranum sp.]|nr:LPS export ABC transporter permease LptG [Thiogranum sp.]
MSRLDRYIGGYLLSGWILVWLIMSAIFSLLTFVDELERTSDLYRVSDAALFILYTLPQRSMDLVPVIVLLGTLVALAGLNKNSEIIAMRAAGMSLGRLFRSVAMPAVLLVIGLYASYEYVAAPLYQQAETQKAMTRQGKANLFKGRGLWSASDYRYFNVRTLQHGSVPTEIYLYQFAPDGRLLDFIAADTAVPAPNREWRLIDVQHKKLRNGELRTEHKEQLDMGPFWSSEELPIIPLSITGMTLTGLYSYTRHLQETNQQMERVEQLFWQKMALPLTAGAMVLLATPIGAGLGTQRSAVFGRNLARGAGIGILFYLATQIINTGGPMLGIPPPVVAFIPVALVLAAASGLFYRMR